MAASLARAVQPASQPVAMQAPVPAAQARVPAFHFPIESMPFDALEGYLGRGVKRDREPVKSIGEYNEKHDISLAKEYLGRDWWAVEAALDTDIGERYYDRDNLEAKT